MRRLFRSLWFQTRALFGSRQKQNELNEEIQFHLDARIEDLRANGLSETQARREALLEIGGLDQTKEYCRDSWRPVILTDLVADLRFSWRQMAKSPGFTGTVILTLAIGIGASTAIYSLAYGVLYKPLPYPQSEQLVMVSETHMPEQPFVEASPATYLHWKESASDFQALAASYSRSYNVSGAGEVYRVHAQSSSANFFQVLGVPAALGRTFLPGEDSSENAHVLILSHNLWKTKFNRDPNVVGQTLLLDNTTFTVIGVMPESYQFSPNHEIFTPIPFSAESLSNFDHNLGVIGRLNPDVNPTGATTQLAAISARLAVTQPASHEGYGARTMPLSEAFSMNSTQPLYLLLGAVGCLLLIACTNIANLLLARSSSRRAEVAVRTALGASRGRIVRQLLCESLLLAGIGGGFGVLIGHWGLTAIMSFLPPDIAHSSQFGIDGAVILFTSLITLFTGLAFGLFPALQASRVDLNTTLKNGGRRTITGNRGSQRLRNTLVIAQVALALVLLSAAGLFSRSILKAQDNDVGYQTDTTYVSVLRLSDQKYDSPEKRAAVIEQLVTSITRVPGIEAATFTNHTLPNSGSSDSYFSIAGLDIVEENQRPTSLYYGVTREYFKTLEIPLLRGRLFTEQDNLGSPRVAVINEELARIHFSDTNPIGQVVTLHGREGEIPREIVGVVGNTIQGDRMEPLRPQIYEPYEQTPDLSTSFVLRTMGPPPDTSTLMVAFHSVDQDIPVLTLYLVAEGLDYRLKPYRIIVSLFGTFSVIALFLASVGIYGVMAYTVAERTNEIGIRMALGAGRGDVLSLVFGQSGRLILIGLVIGIASSLGLAQLMSSMLYETSPNDPLTLGMITLILSAAAFLACLLPASRATKVNPMTALRAE